MIKRRLGLFWFIIEHIMFAIAAACGAWLFEIVPPHGVLALAILVGTAAFSMICRSYWWAGKDL